MHEIILGKQPRRDKGENLLTIEDPVRISVGEAF